ncbi:cupin domain-containing protein [Nibricoccus sp. IMCC34717]|uniref:cupin domain-containing protein n=1 Tax=Nibricoccus sp. IMCC34717 TaxID=3034021 RepID=UPI00384AE0CF
MNEIKTSIHHPDTTKSFWVLADELKYLGAVARPELHIYDIIIPPGSGTPPHRHASMEIFRVTEGEVTFGVFAKGDPTFTVARPGTVVTIESDQGHNYMNQSRAIARMTVVVEKQMHRFFEGIRSECPPHPGPPSAETLERVGAACKEYGIQMLDR